jgi:RNA polymerase sigma-70 factor (ECF subfamily)
MGEQSRQTGELLRRAAAGDQAAREGLFARHRGRLHRMVALRLDRRARARIDPSDVVQEAYLEAARHLADYLQDPKLPFYVWLRCITGRKLMAMLRRELGAEMRDPRREVALYPVAESTTAVLANQLIGHAAGPSTLAIRAELKRALQQAINELDPLDREILILRHFEHLSAGESAQVLGIQQSAASKRYVRALKRLRQVLAQWSNGTTED